MRARLGQNFLVSPVWRRRVAAALAPSSGDAIVEIGGGRGELSELVVASGCELTILELDPALAADLRTRFANEPRVRVIETDVLAADLGALVPTACRGRIFGNLPYYITGPILFRIFAAAPRFRDATVMVQHEVADRILAPPGGSGFGLLSAVCQWRARVGRVFDLPPGAFRPMPQVTSTLLRFEFIEPEIAPGAETEAFLGFLRAAFTHKRKRLATNLAAIAPGARVSEACATLGLAPGARAEQCGVASFIALFRALRGEPRP